MKSDITQRRFLDFLEDRLSEKDRQAIEQELLERSELAEEYSKYRALAKLEALVSQETVELEEDIGELVMDAIEDHVEHGTGHEAYFKTYRVWIGGLTALNCMLLGVLAALLVRGSALPPRTALPPGAAASASALPEGYRSIAIDVAMPRKFVPRRADVRVAYDEGGRRRLHELARFVKVLDVAEAPDSDIANARLTLLVNEKEAERITIARLLGELDLLLTVPASLKASEVRQERITIRDPQGRPIIENAPKSTLAVLYLPDGPEGEPARQVLYNGDWYSYADMQVLGF